MYKKILSITLSLSIMLSGIVAVYADSSDIVYINKGQMDFEKFNVDYIWSKDYKTWAGTAKVVSSEDYPDTTEHGNKVLKLTPSEAGAIMTGIIEVGKWDDKLYSALGAVEDKLIQLKLDFLLPSVLLNEDSMQAYGLRVMPAQGTYAFKTTIYDALKYKAAGDSFVLTDGKNDYVEVSADEWHEAHVIYSFKDKTFRYYLDGELYVKDVIATAPMQFSGNASDWMASGMYIYAQKDFSENAYVIADNLEIYQSVNKLTMSASYDDDTTTATVEFSNDIEEEMLKYLSVCDKDGNDIGANFSRIDSKKAEIIFPQDYLEYGQSYTFDIVATADIMDATLQYILPGDRRVELSFKTPKDKSGIYIDDEAAELVYNGDDIESSSDITYKAVIGNGTSESRDINVGVALYGENETLISSQIKKLTVAPGSNDDTFVFTDFSGTPKFVRVYLWNDNEDSVSGLICEPESSPKTAMDLSDVYASELIPDFDVRVTDSLSNELTISGKFDDTAPDFVTVAMVKGETENLTVDTDVAALGYSAVDENGEFSYKYTLKSESGDYTALVISGDAVYTKSFNYMPISVLADFVKRIADGTVAKEDLCSGTKALNSGFGIDFDKCFNNESEIEYFNYYIDLRRGDFVGPNDDDYVTQFMGAVNNLIAQIYYVGNVSEAKNNEELLDLLDSGIEYTGISFTEFNKLSDGQKNRALSKIRELTFSSMEEIKSAFDKYVKAVTDIVYLKKGFSYFDDVTSITSNGDGYQMKFNGGNIEVVNDDVAKLLGNSNKALKTAPSAVGKGFNFGLINTGQYDDSKYTALGLDESKLLCFGLDVYFPSQVLDEEYMSSTGLTLMPGSGNFVFGANILTGSVFKKVNANDDYLTFVSGEKAVKMVETDKWHNISIVYDFTAKTIRYYIDGEICLNNYDVTTALNLGEMACGIRYTCPSTVSSDFTIYFDNIEIYQAANNFSATAEYDSTTDKLNLNLSGTIEQSDIAHISVAIDGKAVTSTPILSADGRTLSYDVSGMNLKNDKEYPAQITLSQDLVDAIYQYAPKNARSVDYKFTTTRSKEMYVTDNCTFDGTTYMVEINNLSNAKEARVAVAVYDENEWLSDVYYVNQTMQSGINTVEFANIDSSKQIKTFLWTDNWSLKHNPIVVNAQEELDTPIKDSAVVPEYSVVPTDAGNEIWTLSGKYSGEEYSFVTVIISNEGIENYATATVALETTRTDKNGLFGCSFKMSEASGTYKAYVIINGTIYPKSFSYSSLADTANAVKNVANDTVSQSGIYDSIIVYNSGFGIDTSYFTTQTRKDTFNKRIVQNKAKLTGPTDVEYVAQFMSIVKDIISELDYTKELQDIPYAGSIKSKLESGIIFTNISFTNYNNLTSYQQSLVNENMLQAEFTDGDDIKSKFDGFVSNAKGKTPTSSGGSSSGGSSSGGGGKVSVAPSSFNNSNVNKTESEKDLFNDLNKSHWASAAVARLVNKNIVNGMDNGNFEPDLNVTREQFIKMAILASGIKYTVTKSEFGDVADDAWYCEYIMAAKNEGIINGISENKFGTGSNITRVDMAVIVYNILKKKNVDMGESDNSLDDFDSISDYAKEAVSYLYAKKIINGMDDGTFSPKNYATRAQAATIIDAMMTK